METKTRIVLVELNKESKDGTDVTLTPQGVRHGWAHSSIVEEYSVAPVGGKERLVEQHDNGRFYLMERQSATQWRLVNETTDPRPQRN